MLFFIFNLIQLLFIYVQINSPKANYKVNMNKEKTYKQNTNT
jgi:hypothetical protein